MAKVLIAVSGTGGHVYPGIALAEELCSRRPGLNVVFATARGKPGATWIADAGFDVRSVRLRGFARRPDRSWLTFPFTLLAGMGGAISLLVRERPDLVVGTGGYVSGPFVAFASILRIPTVILEQNSIPGVATRLGSLFAREVHLADPASRARLLRKGRARVSGNPVRRSLETGDAARFRVAHGLPEGGVTVLVIGGSQGAQALTEAAIDAAVQGPPGGPTRGLPRIHWVIQTGERGIDSARLRAAGAEGVTLLPFIGAMGDAYAAADLIVARAGAMTLAELGAVGVPSVLVPYPFAAEDHQTLNARRYAADGAAVVVPQSELTSGGLARTVAELAADSERRGRMADAAKRTEGAGARGRIADALGAYLG